MKLVILFFTLLCSLHFAQCPEATDILDKPYFDGQTQIVWDEFGIIYDYSFSATINGNSSTAEHYTAVCSGEGTYAISFDTDGRDDSGDPSQYNYDDEKWHKVYTEKEPTGSPNYTYWVRPPSGSEVTQPDFLLDFDGDLWDATFTLNYGHPLVEDELPIVKDIFPSTFQFDGPPAAWSVKKESTFAFSHSLTYKWYINNVLKQSGSSNSYTYSSMSNFTIKCVTTNTVDNTSKTISQYVTVSASKQTAEKIFEPTYKIAQNYPNPFNPQTSISYSLENAGYTNITVFNSLGKEVQTLVDSYKDAGSYNVSFDGSNLPSGMYFYRIQSVNFVETKKMILIK